MIAPVVDLERADLALAQMHVGSFRIARIQDDLDIFIAKGFSQKILQLAQFGLVQSHLR